MNSILVNIKLNLIHIECNEPASWLGFTYKPYIAFCCIRPPFADVHSVYIFASVCCHSNRVNKHVSFCSLIHSQK